MALGFLCGIEDLLASGSQFVWTVTEQVLRRCYSDGLVPCRRLIHSWWHIGDVYQMTEGRQCQVLLLDDRQLELLVQPKLLSRDLLDMVSSHFSLKEKEYFGISYTDTNGQTSWLQLNRRVLEHNFSKKTGPLELKFQVRFYIESITFLKDTTTVELFYWNAKSSVYNGTIELESENVFKLAAFVLQEAKGDYTSDESATSDLKKLPVFPTAVLKEHPSLAYCEDRVVEHYKTLKGLTRGKAIIQYLLLVEALPSYGVHYYEVKDKQGIPWWLGISYKGVAQYDQQDKLKPRKVFHWKQLENLYFREKKFAVEVNDPSRRASSKSTFGQSGQAIHTWYASHSLIKTIWAMAISQHQFYLDCKQSKSKITTSKNLGDIAMDLTEIGASRVSRMVSGESKDKLIMASNGSLASAGSADSEVNEELKKEKIAELKKKEQSLQDLLTQKLTELKKICLREAELTGKLPKEYPLASGEKPPTIRRRVGAAFKLDDLFPYYSDPQLRNLESQFALQQKIVEAAKKLANETELCKTVKKKRRRNFEDAMKKLQTIENEINDYRVKMGKTPTQRASLIITDDMSTAELSSLSDSLNLDDDEAFVVQRQRSRSVQYSPRPSDNLGIPYPSDRRASEEPHSSDRLNYGEVQEPYSYIHQDTLSPHSSPYYTPSRQAGNSRSMPPTPQLTRNAFSSIQLRCEEDAPEHFRQRSGSLESQSLFTSECDGPEPVFTITPAARRSNSTEVLDDVSSHTSQSSTEYCAHSRARNRHRRQRDYVYANTGSMPNLAQNESQCYTYKAPTRPTTTAYYVTGYPCYADPYTNGSYAYEDETAGHYSINPSYQTLSYHAQEQYSDYSHTEMDSMSQNPYATLRQARSRPPSRNENLTRNMQKAMVAEHLRGWYNRNTAHKQMPYEYERESQQSQAYRMTPHAYGYNDRSTSYASVSTASNTGTWRDHLSVGLSEYSMGLHPQHAYSYNSVHHSHLPQSRSYIDVNQMDSHLSSPVDSFDSEDQTLYWHEDSKPGTIVLPQSSRCCSFNHVFTC
ncbi:FERM domain-containing protein 4B isoform X3 [Pangasianodon hypophthalmus]|uniref:FERM domain-containing protein 4B isoform X3 n=1 Tax=Pangasianodon hypophthalmus TaxID=310915 RepID=UPI00230732BE|nr:FERM domain-containing protein 4B isoform X3 [Pangasianodon hypophthalmus]